MVCICVQGASVMLEVQVLNLFGIIFSNHDKPTFVLQQMQQDKKHIAMGCRL